MGTLTVPVVDGIATFSSLTLDSAGTGYTIEAASSSLSSATTNSFNVTAAAATQLIVTAQPPNSVTAGTEFGLTITAEDVFDNVATSFVGQITISLDNNPGASTFGGTLIVTPVNGVATFSGLTLNKVGSGYTLEAKSAGVSTATTNAFAVTAASASQLVITAQPPTSVAAGTAFGLTVSAEDSYGNAATSFDSPVTLAVASGPGTLSGTVTLSATSGVAIFTNLLCTTSGSITISASGSVGQQTLMSPPTGAITVNPASPAQLVIETEPSSTGIAGQPFTVQPVVEEEDRYGNIVTTDNTSTVTAARGSLGTSTLQGADLTVVLVNGVATFSGLAYDKAESLDLNFTSSTSGVGAASSAIIVVSPAPASQLAIAQQPSGTATAGQSFVSQPAIDEEDQFGNLETGDNSTVVTVSLASGNGPLQGMTNATLSGGVATFTNLADDLAENITLNFSGGGFLAGPSNSIAVSPGPVSKLVIQTQPAPAATAGVKLATQPVIDEVDRFGNLETGDNSTMITASIASGSGPLQGTTTATVAGGVATFANLADDVAGAVTLDFSGDGLNVGPSIGIAISPGPSYALLIHTQPSTTATAGAALFTQPVIYEVDQFGNLETGDSRTVVTASLASGNGPLQGATTATLNGGVATFTSLADDVAGSIAVDFTGGGLSAGPSTGITINPGPSYQLVIHTRPSASLAAGVVLPNQPVIYEEDRFGNLETGDSSTVVTASLDSGIGPLQGVTTATVSEGVATFANLADDRAETITLGFSGGGLSVGPSTAIAISPGPSNRLVIHTQPTASGTAGVALATQPVIYEEDQFGNLETGDNSTVISVSLASGAGPLQGTATATVSGGVATFTNLADDTAETIALDFSGGGYSAGPSTSVAINPGPVYALLIHTQPSASAIAGIAFTTQPVIYELDQFGNLETGDNSSVVSVSLTSGAGPLRGTATATVNEGIATFTSLADDLAETIALEFNSGSLSTSTSTPIAVVAAPATKLVISSEPPNSVVAGKSFGLQVEAEDSFGNVNLTYDGPVTVAIKTNPGGSTLSGSHTVAASAGAAKFGGLSIGAPGNGYTLQVSSGSLNSATTSAVTVERDSDGHCAGALDAEAEQERQAAGRARLLGLHRAI